MKQMFIGLIQCPLINICHTEPFMVPRPVRDFYCGNSINDQYYASVHL